MRHHDRFGGDADPDLDAYLTTDDDVTREFWGPGSGWGSRGIADEPHAAVPQPAHGRRRDDTTGAVRAIREGFDAFRPHVSDSATGQIHRVRHHGERQHGVASVTPPRADGDRFEPVPRSDHTAWVDDDDLIPLGPPTLADRFGLGSIDPFLVRIAVVVVAFVMLIPLALSLRSEDSGTVTTGSGDLPVQVVENPTTPTTVAPATGPDESTAAETATETPTAEPATEPAPASDPTAPTVEPDTEPTTDTSNDTTVADDGAGAEIDKTSDVEAADARTSGLGDQPATVAALADRVEPNCSQSYIAQAGDSWYGIAEAAGVTPTELISENRATLETVIAPGDEVCLPDGATVPTTAPPASDPDDETPPEEPTPTTTEPPTTTTEPAATAPSYSTDEVQQIIRDVWPDELEEKALEIAHRESRYEARAYNGWCCYGVFQLYWTVHQGWLGDHGIDSIEDLYDARKNTEAAYAMYQASGWGPWGG